MNESLEQPCPFCGIECAYWYNNKTPSHYYVCPECGDYKLVHMWQRQVGASLDPSKRRLVAEFLRDMKDPDRRAIIAYGSDSDSEAVRGVTNTYVKWVGFDGED